MHQMLVPFLFVGVLAGTAGSACDGRAAQAPAVAPADAVAALSAPGPGTDTAWLAPAGDTAAVRAAAAAVTAGLAHAGRGDAAAAVAAYGRAAELVPAFQPWAHALMATAAARSGDAAAVRRHLAATDSVIARDWGWRALVEVALAAGDTAAAARAAAAAAAAMPDTARRVQAWTRAGTLHAASGRTTEAAAMLRRALDEGVGSAAAVEAARALAALPGLTAQDHRRSGRAWLRHRDMARATAAYDRFFAASSLTAAERAAIQLDLGRALFETRDYAAAERRLRSAVSAGGNREHTAEAALLLGRSLYRQGRMTDARALFLTVTRDHAGTTAAARAHFIIADLDHDDGRSESAQTHYRAVVRAGGPDAAVSAARLGSFALMDRRYRDAAAVFAEAHATLSGPARQLAGYWWGHALEAAGARDSAQALFAEARRMDPFSYYGLQAGARLGAEPWDFGPGSPAPTTAQVRAELTARLDALDVLRAAGLTDAGELEAARITEQYTRLDGAMYALGQAYHARGQTFNGVRIGRELLRRENGVWNRALLELVYPFPFRDDVVRYARAHDLDPWLVAGLIRQESMFNPRARSPVGALGLMQVMPATGTAVARSLGIPGFQPARLTEPALNLRIGTKYLADQIRSHNGRLVDAIAAYNAGPQRVTRWRQFPEYADSQLFIERIPFEETRSYVKIVQQNAHIYRELYGR